MGLTFHIATEKRPDGLFAGTAWTQNHETARAIWVDYADGFTDRTAARRWANGCRIRQRKAAR